MSAAIIVNGLARSANHEDLHTVMESDDNIEYIVEYGEDKVTKIWNRYYPLDMDEEFVIEKIDISPFVKSVKKPKKKQVLEDVLTEEVPHEVVKVMVKKPEDAAKAKKVVVDGEDANADKPKGKKLVSKDHNAKVKSAYSIFLSEALKQISVDKSLNHSAKMKKVQEMWRARKESAMA